MKINDLLRAGPVIPVLVIDNEADAVPLAEALVAGGIRVLEVTLRTPAALAAMRAIVRAVPEAIVGVGTVSHEDEFARAAGVGARFAVSPGITEGLIRAAGESGLPYLPGVMTPSEVIFARAAGLAALKLFPASLAGGLAMLRAIAGPFPDVTFCPTGGISAETAPDYLALKNVACVGGSWLTPKAAVAAKDWPAITALARQAAALRPTG
jgi:2-dehydro-3-deoxyphosphogluconate aldolase/(4S)-4-hydroxy-2-oxoglutarate aldolase